MSFEKVKYCFFIVASFSLMGGSTSAQCLVSVLNATSYTTGGCRDLQFQQAIGSVFTGYGKCGELSFTAPLTDSEVITGSYDEQLPAQIQVYPNPTKDRLFFKTQQFQSGQIRMYTLMGQLIHASRLQQTSDFSLDISGFPNGVYLIKVILDDKKCSTYTIIKS